MGINSWKIPSLLLKNEDIDKLNIETDIESHCKNEQTVESEKNLTMKTDGKNDKEQNKKPSFESKMIELLPKIGDMVIFSSYTFHKSNCNSSNKIRRVIMTQYSTFPIIDRINKKLAGLVVKL